MRDIENIIVGLLKIEDTHPTEMFFLESYINEQNGQKYLQYYMNVNRIKLNRTTITTRNDLKKVSIISNSLAMRLEISKCH